MFPRAGQNPDVSASELRGRGFSSWKEGDSGIRWILGVVPPVTRRAARTQRPAKVVDVLGGERVRLKVVMAPPEGVDECSGRRANKRVDLTLRSGGVVRSLGLHLATGVWHVARASHTQHVMWLR